MDLTIMFHIFAHKHVGPKPPGQVVVKPQPPEPVAKFTARTESGRPRREIAYTPLSVVICGRRYDFALHSLESVATPWAVSDPVSGQMIAKLAACGGDLRQQAAQQLRVIALNLGGGRGTDAELEHPSNRDRFHEHIEALRKCVNGVVA